MAVVEARRSTCPELASIVRRRVGSRRAISPWQVQFWSRYRVYGDYYRCDSICYPSVPTWEFPKVAEIIYYPK